MARALGAGYGPQGVLFGVDLSVRRGEIVAVVGPSGSGKSTLLGALSGLVRPVSGSVRLWGEEISRLPAEEVAARGVAHVPERRRLFNGLTVRENLLLGGWRSGRGDLAWVLELFPALALQLGRPAGQLSAGEQQLCALARGLMADPCLMLVDGLSLGLSPAAASRLFLTLPSLAASGMGIVLVDQDAGVALSVAERGYVLDAGRLVAEGSSSRLMADVTLQERYLKIP